MTTETPAVGLTTRPTTGTNLPPHGTLRRAMGDRRSGRPRCHCQPCRTVERRYDKHRRVLAHTGRPLLVDATPAREHLAKLRDAGDAVAVISLQYGIPRHSLEKISSGTWLRIRATTAAKILAIKPGTAASDFRSVSSLGAIRRVRALMAAGHPLKAIAAEVGMQHTTASNLANGYQATIRHELNERVRKGYVALASSRGTSARSLHRAEREGWRDPVWWEDMGHIDDPTFDPAAAEQELNRDELAALRRKEIEHLASYGFDAEAIAERLGIHVGTVRAILQELRTGQRRDRRAAA